MATDITLTPDEARRFLARLVFTPTGCIEFRGETNNHGYGRFVVRRNGRRHRPLAHRIAYAMVADIDPGAVVRHSCDNPPCVNPEHLLVGTQRDNILDARDRGRLVTDGLEAYRRQRRAIALARLAAGVKTCTRCKVEKPFDGFFRNRARFDGRQDECMACALASQRERRVREEAA